MQVCDVLTLSAAGGRNIVTLSVDNGARLVHSGHCLDRRAICQSHDSADPSGPFKNFFVKNGLEK